MMFLAFTLSALGGCLAGLWLGAWLQRWIDSGHPEVTAWGESTAQWSAVDWDWFERYGRRADPAMSFTSQLYRQLNRGGREAAVEHVANLAGVDAEGSILPPPEGYSPERRAQSWWRSSGEADA